MKILQTPPRIWTTGGVETYVSRLSIELAKCGHQVKILCADTGGPGYSLPGVHINPLKSIARIGNTPITPTLPLAILRSEPDLIHTHLPTPWSADWSRILASFMELPLVLTYHSGITGLGAAGIVAHCYNGTALRSLFQRADTIIITRGSFMPAWMQHWQTKIEVIPIGVDPLEFYPIQRERDIDVFFLSVLDRFHHFKRLDVLLKAVRRIVRDRPDLLVVIGGGGPEISNYMERVHDLGIGPNVRFAEYIPREKLNEWYNRSRVFVLPSTDPALETFGIVILEAMASGRPVITTEIAGAAEDIQSYGAGIVMRSESPDSLAMAITTILDDHDLAEKMGSRGRQVVEERYLWHDIAIRIEEIYNKLLSKTNKA
jgi:glycosyltransferase involved in cell wall biosynthesis